MHGCQVWSVIQLILLRLWGFIPGASYVQITLDLKYILIFINTLIAVIISVDTQMTRNI